MLWNEIISSMRIRVNHRLRIAKVALAMFLLAVPGVRAQAQSFSVATDLLSYANLATINGEISYSVSQHWTTSVGFKYNPFTFRVGEDKRMVNNRQRTVSLGGRYWLWHVYSGWWMSAKLQYQEYNKGGWKNPETKEGDRYGVGLSSGYSYMIASWLNLELSAGVWAGRDNYRIYDCPKCGVTLEDGSAFFVLPHDIMLSLSFVF